jgi:hypothetical protein
MRYAILASLGGELIEAEKADYSDYFGFLKCPACGEPVFLRKAHKRLGLDIPASFVHHKAIPEVSICENRVNGYSREDFERYSQQAKGQRLQKLSISMWKYLKTNLTIDLNMYSWCKAQVKKFNLYRIVTAYGLEVVKQIDSYILNEVFPIMSELIKNQNSQIWFDDSVKAKFTDFIKNRSRDWALHEKIASEALQFFLTAESMKEARYKLILCACHPKSMNYPGSKLLDLKMDSDRWRVAFVSYISILLSFIFLSVDWIGLFSVGASRASESRVAIGAR